MSWKDRAKKVEGSWKDRAIPVEDKMSAGESTLRGAEQGATLGYSDEIAGGVQSLLDFFGGNVTDVGKQLKEQGFKGDIGATSKKELYEESRDAERALNKKAQADNPGFYTGGNIAGGVLSSLVPGASLAKGSSLTKAGIQGAGIGAAAGLGASDEELASKEALKDLAMGGATGGAFGVAGQKLSNMIGKVDASKVPGELSDELKRVAEIQSAKAQGLERGTRNALNKNVSPGQIDKKVRAIGRQGLDEDVLGDGSTLWKKIFGNNAEEMIQRNQEIKDAAMSGRQTAYDIIDASGVSDLKPQDIADKIEKNLGGFNKNSKLNSGKLSQLDDTLQAVKIRGEDPISMNKAQELVEELRDAAKLDQNRSTPVADLAEGAYFTTRDMINEASERAGDKIGIEGLGDLIRGANKKYSISMDADKLMGNKLARGANKSIGLTDTIVGVTNPYLLPFKTAWERGGNRAAAIGLDKLGDMVKNNAQSFGKFQGVLQNASQRGGNALGATHYMLYQQNPEYREMLKAQEEEGNE